MAYARGYTSQRPRVQVAHGGSFNTGPADGAKISIFQFKLPSPSTAADPKRLALRIALVSTKLLPERQPTPSSLCASLPPAAEESGVTDGCGALLLASGVCGQALYRWHDDSSMSCPPSLRESHRGAPLLRALLTGCLRCLAWS